MIRRRDFIAYGITSGLLATLLHPPASASGSFDAATGSRCPAGLRFIADRRSKIALDAARRAALHGAMVDLIGDDITRLYQRLDLALSSSPFPIAGVTSGNALFVIERLAWERGLRTVFRARHVTAGGHTRHTLDGPGMPTDDPAWVLSGHWPAAPAPASTNPESHAVDGLSVSLLVPHDADATVLYSWLIVPRAHLRRARS